jgi:hypothetical protein
MKLNIISVQRSQNSDLLRTFFVDSLNCFFNKMINETVEFLVSYFIAVLILNFDEQCLKVFKIEALISLREDKCEFIAIFLYIIDHLAVKLKDTRHALTAAPLFHKTD